MQKTIVEGEEATLLRSFRQTIRHTSVLLNLAKVGAKDGTHIDQRVHQSVCKTSGKSTAGDLGGCKHGKVGILVVLREHPLDGVLEHEVEGSRRHVTNAVGNVSAPERAGTEFGDDVWRSPSYRCNASSHQTEP